MSDLLGQRWYVRENDSGSGWVVLNVDKPPSETDFVVGEWVIGRFPSEELAEHAALTHNTILALASDPDFSIDRACEYEIGWLTRDGDGYTVTYQQLGRADAQWSTVDSDDWWTTCDPQRGTPKELRQRTVLPLADGAYFITPWRLVRSIGAEELAG